MQGACRVLHLSHSQWLLLADEGVMLRSFGRRSTSEQEARAWAAHCPAADPCGDAASGTADTSHPNSADDSADAVVAQQPPVPPTAFPPATDAAVDVAPMPPMLRFVTFCVATLAVTCVAAGAGLAHAAAVLLGSASEHGRVTAASASGAPATSLALQGLAFGADHPHAMGVIATIGAVLLSSFVDTGAMLQRVAHAFRQVANLVRQRAGLCVMVIFIWSMVVYSHAASADDLTHFDAMVRSYSHNLDFSRHLHLATQVSAFWSDIEYMPPLHPHDTLVLLAGGVTGCSPDSVVVFDTGAKRPVIRDPSAFDTNTRKPCPFRVRGVAGTAQPDFMGDATVHLPTSDEPGGVAHRTEPILLRDAVCMPECPHDVIAVGPLLWEGMSAVLGRRDEQSWMRLASGGYVALHNQGILFVNRCSAPCPAPTDAVHTLNDLPPASAKSTIPTGSRAFYACSGPKGNKSGFAAWWSYITAGTCDEFDKEHGTQGHLLLNSTFAPLHAKVVAGEYWAGLLTPPCGQFNPRRILFPDQRFPVLRTIFDHALGVNGLEDIFQRSVSAVNVLIERVCLLAGAMTDLRRPWIIENPPARSHKTGPFQRFFRQVLELHGSFWDVLCVRSLRAHAKALFAHLPMCHFGMPEQKYLTFMYPPYMRSAMQCADSIRCQHTSHASIAGGFDDNGRPLGAETGIHPGGLSQMLSRALAHPDVPCLLDEAILTASTPSGAAASEPTPRGLPADRSAAPPEARSRGKRMKPSSITSVLLHDRFHRPSPLLRRLHYTCADVPESWTQVLDVDACDACLRAKATHLHHDGTLPECKAPGEILAFDLWKTQEGCLFGGEQMLFGVIALYSSWSEMCKLKSKTDVPEAIAMVLRVAASFGINILRMHTDNEVIFHTTAARDSTIEKYKARGVLITTGCEYASRQNSKIERLWRTCSGDARASLLNQPNLGAGYFMSAVIDANQKRLLLHF